MSKSLSAASVDSQSTLRKWRHGSKQSKIFSVYPQWSRAKKEQILTGGLKKLLLLMAILLKKIVIWSVAQLMNSFKYINLYL